MILCVTSAVRGELSKAGGSLLQREVGGVGAIVGATGGRRPTQALGTRARGKSHVLVGGYLRALI
jgi:hypothetical protein